MFALDYTSALPAAPNLCPGQTERQYALGGGGIAFVALQREGGAYRSCCTGPPVCVSRRVPSKAHLACERFSVYALACRTKDVAGQADGREWWGRECEDELYRTVPVPNSRLVAPLGLHGASTNRPKDLISWLLCVSNARAVRGV